MIEYLCISSSKFIEEELEMPVKYISQLIVTGYSKLFQMRPYFEIVNYLKISVSHKMGMTSSKRMLNYLCLRHRSSNERRRPCCDCRFSMGLRLF